MANLTKAQMVAKTMRRLGVLANGQSASASDAAEVTSVIESVYRLYREKGMAPFGSNAYPDWAQEPFAMIVGAKAAPYFGLDRSAWEQQGYDAVAEYISGGITGRPLEAEYF